MGICRWRWIRLRWIRKRANDAIEHLATARGELTRTISQMTLRRRTILTDEQWQELQRRQEDLQAGRWGRTRRQRGGRLWASSGGRSSTQQRP